MGAVVGMPSPKSQGSEVENVRIDKWLWAARFYKTRSLAATAVQGGKVHVNGQRVKASRVVVVGDKIEISRSPEIVQLHVLALSARRGSASVAQLLYEETQESQDRRKFHREQRKILNASMPVSRNRPDKHQRKKIRTLLGKD